MTSEEIINKAVDSCVGENLTWSEKNGEIILDLKDILRKVAQTAMELEREYNMQMQNVLIDAAILAEREACAKEVENHIEQRHGQRVATAAIRGRK